MKIIGLSSSKAIRLGMAIIAFSVSATSQMIPRLPTAPMGITRTHATLNGVMDFTPNKYPMHFSQ